MPPKIHSNYCTFASICDKEHNCMAGDFCDAYEARYPSGLIADIEVKTLEEEFADHVGLDRRGGLVDAA